MRRRQKNTRKSKLQLQSYYSAVTMAGVLCLSTFQETAYAQGKFSDPPEIGKAVSAVTIEKDTQAELPTELISGLSLEHRRYLTYLYARVNKPKLAEHLAEQIFKETPGDKQTYLVLCSMYIEQKEQEKAIRTARELVKLYPDDDQAIYFLGASYYLANQYQEANNIFRSLKNTQFKTKAYPYTIDLASSALKAGDWYRAMLAYQEILRRPVLSEELRLEVRKVLEGIYREHLPQIDIAGTGLWLKFGTLYQLKAEYQQHLKDQHQVFVNYTFTETQLKNQINLRTFSEANSEGRIGVNTAWRRQYFTSLWVGGDESGALAGGSLKRIFGEERFIKLELSGNERAHDGLIMEALDGRQNRLSIYGNYMFSRRWLTYIHGYGREVTIEGDHIGWGQGASWNIEHILPHGHPEFRIGYQGTWGGWQLGSQDSSILNRVTVPGLPTSVRDQLLAGLILKEIHREGLYWSLRDQISGFFHYYGGSGVEYAFERGSPVFTANVGFRIYPRKSLEFRTEGMYTTSAKTSDADSDEFLLTVAIKYWF